MYPNRPWHPFRQPGMCGMRGTTIILILLSIIITGIILSQEVNFYREGNETVNTRPKREVEESFPDDSPLDLTFKAGSSANFLCDPISSVMKDYYNTEAVREQYGESLYICKEPCGWAQVTAYHGPEATGTDPRFGIQIVELKHRAMWGGKRCIYCDERRVIPDHFLISLLGGARMDSYARVMNVTITDVTFQDEGTYYCVWALAGRDGYQEVRIKIEQPKIHEVKEIIQELSARQIQNCPEQGEASQDIDFFMNSNLNQETKEVRVAKAKCGGNYACALALLQRGVVADEVIGDCWVCLQLHSMWKTQELTADMLLDDNGNCEMPKQMSLIVQMALNIREERIPTSIIRDYNCSYSGAPFQGPALQVHAHPAELCVCSKSGKHRVGTSDCKNTIIFDQTKSGIHNCTVNYHNKSAEGFECPFTHLDSAPGMVWVCGETAYYHLDSGQWKGCCYAAILSTGTSIIKKEKHQISATSLKRQKREVTMPKYYAGHVTRDPWTTPWENVGWSIAGLVTGTGTTVALNKINGLAWQVLSLENDTAQALSLISSQLKKMRVAVVQHRLALDILTAEKGGVCKMLGVSCCFSIPDYSDNITDVVKHMRDSVREPKPVDATWFHWLDSLTGGWGHWITSTVIPIVVSVLALLLLLPCMLQSVIGCAKRSVASFNNQGTYQMMVARRTTERYQTLVIRQQPEGYSPGEQSRVWGSTFDNLSDTDDDENDYVHTYELEPQLPRLEPQSPLVDQVQEGLPEPDEREMPVLYREDTFQNDDETDNSINYDESVIDLGTFDEEEF